MTIKFFLRKVGQVTPLSIAVYSKRKFINLEIFQELNIDEKCVEDMALSIRDNTITVEIQATHHHIEIRYDISTIMDEIFGTE